MVQIRQIPTITIRDYSKHQSLIHERPDESVVDFPVDNAKYFDFICDDIDVHQSDIDIMNTFSDDAGQQMKITIDTQILEGIYADGASTNEGASAGAESGDINLGVSGTPLAVTKSDILDVIVDCETCLNENNVPEEMRWLVVPMWFCGMIKKSDLQDASLSGDATSILRNGRIGMIGNFEIYKSNHVRSSTDGSYTAFNAIFGQRHALSFASQMTKMETLRAESTFGDIVRGLNVYGYKVLKDTAMGHLYIRKGT